ncbi:GNAT family N-acetyltransferase [Halopelagius fulvigenes]|uniref:GNAT family N-acetyltransferase n=1 Tax=Halopelagius fulvigenes TaxID=1198324 RepID=A0ABD5TZD9_9EURY
MPALWRLTRNERARRVYEALKRVGITGTRMYQYVADPRDDAGADAAVEGVAFAARDPTAVGGEYEAFAELRDDETVLCALDGDEIVGHLFVSVDATHRIHPLEETLTFDGGYVRRVFVRPSHRGRGIATALVSRARTVAADAGAGAVHALVALDNKPSQWMFEANGFERRFEHAYYRVGPLRRRRVEDIERT